MCPGDRPRIIDLSCVRAGSGEEETGWTQEPDLPGTAQPETGSEGEIGVDEAGCGDSHVRDAAEESARWCQLSFEEEGVLGLPVELGLRRFH